MKSKIFGINPVKEAIRSGIVEEVYVDKYLKNKRIEDVLKLAEKKGVVLNFVKRSELEGMFNTKLHQGIGAVIKEINLFGEDELIELLPDNPLVVILDGITDTHNLGAILRSCAAFSVDGVFIPRHRMATFSEYVWKSSAGAIAKLKISRVTNISRTVSKLKERFITIVGTDVSGEHSLYDFNFPPSVGVVFGSEGRGMRRIVREKCDYLLKIPMKGGIDSLNVSVSAGIFLSEIIRQRCQAQN